MAWEARLIVRFGDFEESWFDSVELLSNKELLRVPK